jgi:NhaP-type Na+/H+ or K+/H+ antiporter
MHNEEGEHTRLAIVNSGLIMLSLIALYHVIGNYIKRKNLIFGHEASIIVILGMIISYLVGKSHPEIQEKVTFNSNFFFYGCLPPIVFASVYNMDIKVFFQNFSSVMVFGVFGTILQFILFTVGLFILHAISDTFFKYFGGDVVQLTLFEILLMSSLICSSDPVAAISVIRYDQQPKLFSVVVGEGITNDAVGIIIFNTVLTYAAPGATFNNTSVFKIIGSFILLCLVSTLIGFLVGIIGALVFKWFRGLSHNATVETISIMGFGYLSYMLAERVEFSGIISVLSAAFTLRGFAEPNLTEEGRHHTETTLEFVASIFEALVFASIGLSLTTFTLDHYWSVELSLGMFVNVFIFRFVGVFLIIKISELILRKHSGLSVKDLIFISYAG